MDKDTDTDMDQELENIFVKLSTSDISQDKFHQSYLLLVPFSEENNNMQIFKNSYLHWDSFQTMC